MHVVVIGAGVNGLSAAWQVARRGVRVTLLEQFRVGHERGSSHGRSRITRSTYSAQDYVRLMQRAHRESWPQLERDAGTRLLQPVPGCFFGPAGPALDAYTAAVAIVGDAIRHLTPAEGRVRFPLFLFPDADRVLEDTTAALVAAADTIAALARCATALGTEIREETPVLDVVPDDDGIAVRTPTGTVRADRVIVAAGPWAARLVPQLRPTLAVARQTVGYFRLDAPAEAHGPPHFPVWAYLGPDTLHAYGLPEFQRPGVKAAWHVTADRDDDPDETAAADQPRLDDVRTFLEEQLSVAVAECVGSETCLYTNTPTEDFVIDRHPADSRVVVAAGFSGHGFKMGPLTGRLLAELALDGVTQVPEFEAARARFSARR